jgi:predicted Zn-dependent protease
MGAKYGELRSELSAIAGCELGDVLGCWGAWSSEQSSRLVGYLVAEMGPGGLLSVEHARENETSLTVERRQARALLTELEDRS